MEDIQKEKLKMLLSKGITRAERLIIILFYCEEMTFDEIAKILDLSESYVWEIHSSLVSRLRTEMKT